MTQFSYTIQDELGLHARPEGLLAKEAAKFKSTVTVESGAKKGDAKKIMSLMMLGAKKEHTLSFTVEGEDEEACAAGYDPDCKEHEEESCNRSGWFRSSVCIHLRRYRAF